MVAVDTNLLIYAHRADSLFHEQARTLLESLRAVAGPWAVPWPCVHEFIAIVTHARVFKDPTPADLALNAVTTWSMGGNLRFLAESEGYLENLSQLVISARLTGPRIHDARIAALCLHHGVDELWTADRDFSAFPSLKTRNPLVQKW